jgi:hypothetical protein
MKDTVDTADRVRFSSSEAVNRQIDREIEARFAGTRPEAEKTSRAVYGNLIASGI